MCYHYGTSWNPANTLSRVTYPTETVSECRELCQKNGPLEECNLFTYDILTKACSLILVDFDLEESPLPEDPATSKISGFRECPNFDLS